MRLQYGDLSYIFPLITGSTLDLTFKGDMIYMRRVSGGETLYRAMPLSVFGETIMDQLVFMFNMSDDVANILSRISPEQSGSTGCDLGAQAEGILSGYEYLEESGKWVLTFNGGALTGNVLGDIVVTLGTDENGCISSLDVSAGMEKSPFKVALSANLTLQNAGENYENVGEGTDLSEDVSQGMSAAIEEKNENGWNKTYLQGTKSTVSFVVDGETVKTQDVLVNGETVLTKIDFPELEEKEGYTLKWVQSGLTFKPEYTPNTYHVQFTTEDALADGFETEYDLAYGTAIEYYVNGELRSTETVGAADTTFEMPVLDERSVWYKAEASGDVLRLYAYENYDTVTFDDGFGGTSTENFIVDYALPTPTKEGYTFLGWWKETDKGWEKVDSLVYSGGADVTLHALWAEDLTVDVACSRGSFSWVQYPYTAEGNVDGGHFAGSLKEKAFFGKAELSVAVSYRVESGLVGKTFSGECDENGNFKVTGETSLYLNWTVTATATLNIGGHTFTMTGVEKGSF